MTWLNTLLSPDGFLFHVVAIVSLTVLLAVGVGPASSEWAALAVLLGVSIGTGTQTLKSAANAKANPPA